MAVKVKRLTFNKKEYVVKQAKKIVTIQEIVDNKIVYEQIKPFKKKSLAEIFFKNY